MTPQEMEKLPKPLEKTISKLELEVMGEVVDRIKKAYEIAPVGEHMLDRLTLLDRNGSNIKKLLKEKLEQANIDIDKIYDKAVEADYITHKDLFNKAGKEYLAYEDNEWLKQLVNATREHTKDNIKPFENITKATGFNVMQNGKLAFTPLSDYFAKSLDKSLIGIASGAYTYSQAIGSVIDEMTNSGLRVVNYASGKTDRIEVAARRALMTGVAQMTNQINESNAKKLDTDYFEVDWHPGARNKGIGIENHQAWQGKVYSRQEMITVCGEGDILGFAGINCYHIKWPFIKGISKRKYTDEWLKEQNEKENTPKEFNGKEYTVYDALQYQRKLERTIRKLKQDVLLLGRAEVDKDVLIAKQSKLQSVKALYTEFSKAMGLPQQLERLKVGVGNNSERGISSKKGAAGDSSKVDLKFINSKQYKAKFKTITDNQDVNESIYQRAKAMLIHRNGTRLEDMYLLDKSKGEIVGSQTSSSSDYEVEYNKSLLNAVSKSQPYSLISIHNHPTNIPPSGADFASAGFRRYKMGVIACHNGDIYTYEVGNKPFSARLFDDTVEKYTKMGYTNGVEANIKALEQFEIDYGIKWRKL